VVSDRNPQHLVPILLPALHRGVPYRAEYGIVRIPLVAFQGDNPLQS
jgi:hypothetical protein